LTSCAHSDRLCLVHQQATRRTNIVKRARDPQVVRQALADRTLTHREVASLAGCAHSNVGFAVAGKPISDKLAARFAKILRRPVADLFEDAVSSVEQRDDSRGAVA
jgi:hypothetical protein